MWREVEVLAAAVALGGRASCYMRTPVGGAAMLGAPFERAEVDAKLKLQLVDVSPPGALSTPSASATAQCLRLGPGLGPRLFTASDSLMWRQPE